MTNMKKTVLLISFIVGISYAKSQDSLNIPERIISTYDSYDLINMIKSKPLPLSTADSSTIARNKQHIVLMLANPYFFQALTTEQKNQLQVITE